MTYALRGGALIGCPVRVPKVPDLAVHVNIPHRSVGHLFRGHRESAPATSPGKSGVGLGSALACAVVTSVCAGGGVLAGRSRGPGLAMLGPRLVRRHWLGVVWLVQVAASTDADPINDDRAGRGQYREILAGIILIGDQRCRPTDLVEGLAEETVSGGGRGLERNGWFESVFGQQGHFTGDGPGGVRPGQDGNAEAVGEREQCREPLPVLGNPPLGGLRGSVGQTEHRAQCRRPGGPGPGHQPQRRFVDGGAVLEQSPRPPAPDRRPHLW